MPDRITISGWIITAVATLLLVGAVFSGLGARDVLRLGVAICGFAVAGHVLRSWMLRALAPRQVVAGVGIGAGFIAFGFGALLGVSEPLLTLVIIATALLVGVSVRPRGSRVMRR
jgi:MFS-type transporter involved in bile tolerance (Atg22 family)